MPAKSKSRKTQKNQFEEELDPSTLNEDQAKLLDTIEEGHNIFFTGSAGTGKSYVMQHIGKFKESTEWDNCKRAYLA